MNLNPLRRVVIAAALGCAGLAHADAPPPACTEPHRTSPPYDHERARAALTRGEVVPLRRVLEAVERQGDILKIELQSTEAGAFVYKLKLLTRDGRVVKKCVDARTGALLAVCPDT